MSWPREQLCGAGATLAAGRLVEMNSNRRQYQTDSEGRRTAVVLSIAEHERLQRDLHDLGEIAERHDEPTVDDRELKRRLAEGGAV
jgi:hypothetical protein